jgi:tetratricopeptide (TPR) repeat protein
VTYGFDEQVSAAQRAYAEGAFEQAEELARAVVRHCLDHEEAILLIARAAEARGRDRSAALQYCKYGTLTRSPNAYERAGELHTRGDRLYEAAECYECAAEFAGEQNPQEAFRLKELSEALWKKVQAAPDRYPPPEPW